MQMPNLDTQGRHDNETPSYTNTNKNILARYKQKASEKNRIYVFPKKTGKLHSLKENCVME